MGHFLEIKTKRTNTHTVHIHTCTKRRRREREKVYSQHLTEEYPSFAVDRQEVGSEERKHRMADDNSFNILLNSPAQLGQSVVEIPSSPSATVGVKDLETNIIKCKT